MSRDRKDSGRDPYTTPVYVPDGPYSPNNDPYYDNPSRYDDPKYDDKESNDNNSGGGRGTGRPDGNSLYRWD